MKKLFIIRLVNRPGRSGVVLGGLILGGLLGGCSTPPSADQPGNRTVLERLPFVHHIAVRQGNLLDRADLEQLRPGMTKEQVIYWLGTPLLVDVFHEDRWDYVFAERQGTESVTQQRITLFFDGNRLAKVEKDLASAAEASLVTDGREPVVSVPDNRERRGIITRAMDALAGP